MTRSDGNRHGDGALTALLNRERERESVRETDDRRGAGFKSRFADAAVPRRLSVPRNIVP